MLKRLLMTVFAAASLSAAPANRTFRRATDSSGKVLEDATAMVYQAGVKKGYSTFCPSCYVDCGKRAITDRTGARLHLYRPRSRSVVQAAGEAEIVRS
jgi:hypothetical protein